MEAWWDTPSLGIVDFPSTAYEMASELSLTTVVGSNIVAGSPICSKESSSSIE
jgi:hypothetical protein